MAVYPGSRASLRLGPVTLRAFRWSFEAKVEEIDITVADGSGCMNFTADLPKIAFRVEAVWDGEDNPFAPFPKIVPGKRFTDLHFQFDRRLPFPEILISAGLWTGIELLNTVRDCVRFNFSGLATKLPSLPGKTQSYLYPMWNGFDRSKLPTGGRLRSISYLGEPRDDSLVYG